MSKTHKYDETTITAEPLKPFNTTITMDIKDIKHITEENLKTEKTKEEYDEILIKIFWFLKGLNIKKESTAIWDLLTELEEFIYE